MALAYYSYSYVLIGLPMRILVVVLRVLVLLVSALHYYSASDSRDR